MNNKKISLIVVADAHEAKIFEKIGHKVFELNLISRIEAELDTNHEKRDSTHGGVGASRSGVEPHTDRRDVEKQKFASEISKHLSELKKQKTFDNLILVASHKILQDVEQSLSNELAKKVSNKLAKNLLEFKNHEIKEYIEKNYAEFSC